MYNKVIVILMLLNCLVSKVKGLSETLKSIESREIKRASIEGQTSDELSTSVEVEQILSKTYLWKGGGLGY